MQLQWHIKRKKGKPEQTKLLGAVGLTDKKNKRPNKL